MGDTEYRTCKACRKLILNWTNVHLEINNLGYDGRICDDCLEELAKVLDPRLEINMEIDGG